MNKKASVTIYLALIIAVTLIIVITAMVVPFGTLFTAQAYAAGQDILRNANESIQNIDNATIRDSVQGSINEAFEAAEFNINVTTDLYQYSWVFVVLLAGLVAFLFTRALVEVRGGFGGFVG